MVSNVVFSTKLIETLQINILEFHIEQSCLRAAFVLRIKCVCVKFSHKSALANENNDLFHQ